MRRSYAYIDRFEREFAAQLDVHHAIAASNCTGALHMGLAGLGIAAGDEVTLAPKLLITRETGSDPSYRVDFSAFRHALSFEAKWSIPDRAAELYKDYVSAGLTDDDFAKKVHPAAASGSTSRQRCSRRGHATDHDGCVSSAAQLRALASRPEIAETASGHSIARSGFVIRDAQVLGGS